MEVSTNSTNTLIGNTGIIGNQFSFAKGWGQLQQKDVSEVKEKIMKALHITAKSTFYNKLRGTIEPVASEKEAIVTIFNQYGITEIWGE